MSAKNEQKTETTVQQQIVPPMRKHQQPPGLLPSCNHAFNSRLFASLLPFSSLSVSPSFIPTSSEWVSAAHECRESGGAELSQSVEEAEWRQQSSAGPWRLDVREGCCWASFITQLHSRISHHRLQPDSSPLLPLRSFMFHHSRSPSQMLLCFLLHLLSPHTAVLLKFICFYYFPSPTVLLPFFRVYFRVNLFSSSAWHHSIHPSQMLELKS